MADITPTSITVVSGRIRELALGADVTVLGQLLHWDALLDGYQLATAGGTTEQSVVFCMALATGLKDDVIRVAMPGSIIKFDAVLLAGHSYWLSDTLGRISDGVAIGDIVSFLGIAEDTQNLLFNVTNSRTVMT